MSERDWADDVVDEILASADYLPRSVLAIKLRTIRKEGEVAGMLRVMDIADEVFGKAFKLKPPVTQ